ncbi:helix-turn-helix transcriptional regulator [Chloroflexales bacterium ZM16-3]|nr:helix-turn-helix transcriptional regulator [Chloroflexales bacterium ZM16-3]
MYYSSLSPRCLLSELSISELSMTESLHRRIAQRRVEGGWTQQEIAGRLAISRVAVSHVEAGLSVPSERTVTLLAGIFKCEPGELVSGTSYPDAKADRLPAVACRYTEVELQLALLTRDLDWLCQIADSPGYTTLARTLRDRWALIIDDLSRSYGDHRQQELIARARQLVDRF